MRKFVANESHLARCFTATCAVGRALRNSWPQLLEATLNNNFDWRNLVKFLDESCISQFESLPASNDFRSYTEHVRSSLRNVHQVFLADAPSVQAAVLRLIDSIIDWGDDKEIEEHLNQLNKTGLDRAIACVATRGGTLARERLRALRLADLEIGENGQTEVTYTYLPAQDGPVWLAYGRPRGSLLSYLNLEFYFFHEYLSHVFPLWDDLARDFSEGYLFKVAYWESMATSDTVSDIIVLNHDFAQHAATLGVQPGQEGRWKRIQIIADWYREKAGQQTFPTLLLELAAFHDPQRPNLGRQFVRDLYWIANSTNKTAHEELFSAIRGFSGDLVEVMRKARPYTVDTIH